MPWKSVRFVVSVDELEHLDDEEKKRIRKVADKYRFRANSYYLSLINWDDPKDPIRRIVVPDEGELKEWGHLDPSSEASYMVIGGVEHKYEDTVVMLVSPVCGGVCRFCFRKRIFMGSEVLKDEDVDKAVEYVRQHKEVTDVLLTGGDPLMLPTRKLRRIISALDTVPHLRVIRIGSKVPAYLPMRITGDPELLHLLSSSSKPHRRFYIVTQFNHPRELTEQAVAAIQALQKAGCILVNQTPMLRGVNDNPQTLSDLLKRLESVGVPPYYVFQCRPASGNRIYVVPVEEGYSIFSEAVRTCSGLAARARYVMSHKTGKVEIVGLTDDKIVFHYHRCPDKSVRGRVLIMKRNPNALWFDDYPIPEEILAVVPEAKVC